MTKLNATFLAFSNCSRLALEGKDGHMYDIGSDFESSWTGGPELEMERVLVTQQRVLARVKRV